MNRRTARLEKAVINLLMSPPLISRAFQKLVANVTKMATAIANGAPEPKKRIRELIVYWPMSFSDWPTNITAAMMGMVMSSWIGCSSVVLHGRGHLTDRKHRAIARAHSGLLRCRHHLAAHLSAGVARRMQIDVPLTRHHVIYLGSSQCG